MSRSEILGILKATGKFIGTVFGISFFVIAVTTAVVVINAVVIATMWEWFVVPIFGLQVLTITESAGLAVLVQFIHRKAETLDVEPDNIKTVLILIRYMLMSPLMTLGIGYVVKSLM